MFIDTHAHIYSKEFVDDFEAMLLRSSEAGVSNIYMPNIDTMSIERMMEIATNHSNCHAMMGLHPCHVKVDYMTELAIIEKYLYDDKIVGIGEIGIDLYWDKTFYHEQEDAFRRQISMAKSAGLPFVIHSRDSLDLTIDIVSGMQDGSLKGIFHCFNGSKIQAQKIIDIGFLMGIGGVITYKNAGVDIVVADIPIEYLVLETDAPYLSPVPYRGKRNECAYIKEIAYKLAQLKQCPLSQIDAQTTINANNLFGNTP